MSELRMLPTYKFMWAMIRYKPWLYLANGMLWALVHLSPLLPGLIAKAFFDSLTGAAPAGLNAWSLVALLVAAGLGQVLVIYGGALTDIRHRLIMRSLLWRNMLARVLELPGARAVLTAHGDALNRFRDDAEQAEDAVSWTLDRIGTLLFSITGVAVLLTIDARITLLVFAPLAGVVGIAQAASARIERYRQASRAATGRVTGLLGEVFGAVQAVQVAGAEERVIARFRALSDQRRKMMLRDRLLESSLGSIFANIVSLGTGLILILAAQGMREATFTVGDLALFVFYLGHVTEFMQWLGSFLAHYRQTGVAFRRMMELMQGAPPAALVQHAPLYLERDMGDGRPPATDGRRQTADRRRPSTNNRPLLVARGLTYRYPGSGRGIEGIDLELPRGSFTVITGRIGSGKTTLLRALLGLLPLDAGAIEWEGEVVADPATFFVPPQSAYTPQVPQLFSATLRENILLGLGEADERDEALRRAIRLAVLERDLPALAQGLDTIVGSRGVKLSGGQIQRAAAARMFVRQPELLVFDDLSSALDVETEKLLWERLFEGAGDGRRAVTCLVVSHRRAALRRADQIIVLQDGRVQAQGALNELLATRRFDDLLGLD